MPNPSPLRAATAHTPYERQAFHNPHSAISPVGHFAKQAGILSPLMIAEFVKDPEKQLRYTRIALILVTVLSEALWTRKIHRERQARDARDRQEEQRAR
jgi:hypothetical protein